MRKIAALTIVGLAALGLTACAEQMAERPGGAQGHETEYNQGTATYITVPTPSGSVPCITWDNFNGGGISCNWDALP